MSGMWQFEIVDGKGGTAKIGYVPGKKPDPEAEIIISSLHDSTLPQITFKEFEAMSVSPELTEKVKDALKRRKGIYRSAEPAPEKILVVIKVGETVYGGKIRPLR